MRYELNFAEFRPRLLDSIYKKGCTLYSIRSASRLASRYIFDDLQECQAFFETEFIDAIRFRSSEDPRLWYKERYAIREEIIDRYTGQVTGVHR